MRELDEIPAERRRYSPDGKRVAACWVSREREDRYDEDTVWDIAVWDLASKQRLESYTRTCSVSHSSGQESGRPVRDVRFDSTGALRIVFQDGSEEPAREALPEPARHDPQHPSPLVQRWQQRAAKPDGPKP